LKKTHKTTDFETVTMAYNTSIAKWSDVISYFRQYFPDKLSKILGDLSKYQVESIEILENGAKQWNVLDNFNASDLFHPTQHEYIIYFKKVTAKQILVFFSCYDFCF